MEENGLTKYKYNVNKNCIEKDGQFFAYLNSLDAYKIVKELNRLKGDDE